jgi:acetyltransferase-like isoleucine patch superfamily enzyme
MPDYTPLSKLSAGELAVVVYETAALCFYNFRNYLNLAIFRVNLKRIGLTLHPDARIVGSPNTKNFKISGDVFIGMFTVVAIASDKRGGGSIGSIVLGSNVYIGDQCNLRATGGELRIGSDVLIADHVSIVTSNHGFRLGSPICNQPWNNSPVGVIIEDDCWIGSHAVILPGSHIGKGAIVAAGALVNSHVPAYEIWGGIPAKKISVRK